MRTRQPDRRERKCRFATKQPVIYGGGGKVGGAVAREGAEAFLAWRTREQLGAVAADVTVVGGCAEGEDGRFGVG